MGRVDSDIFFTLRPLTTLGFPLALQEVEVLNEPFKETGMACLVVSESSQDCENTQSTFTRYACARGDVFTRFVFDIKFDPFATVRMNSPSY